MQLEPFYPSMNGGGKVEVATLALESAPAPVVNHKPKHHRHHGGADPAVKRLAEEIARFRQLDYEKPDWPFGR